MTHRTTTDKLRAIYLLGAIAAAAIIALVALGNGLDACSASAEVCAYTIR